MLSSIFAAAVSQTDLAFIPALANHRIDVYEFKLSPAGTATAFTFNTKGGGAGVPAYPPIQCPGTNIVAQGSRESRLPEFRTNVGEALTITTGTGATVNGLVKYLYSSI